MGRLEGSPEQWVQLAIETTGTHGSVALMRGETVLRHTNLDPAKRTAATLAPEIEAVLQWCRDHDSHPHFLVVADGPGSFTGLRIGITTAKTLGYALQIPVIGVDSLASIAAAAFDTHGDSQSILVGVDAYRRQIFVGQFDRADLLPPIADIGDLWTAHPDSVALLDDQAWRQRLAQRGDAIDVAGDTKPLGDDADRQRSRRCDAVGAGLLGLRGAIRGEFVDAMSLVPRYLKLSAAEEKAIGARADRDGS